ncbi:MAG: transposase, partial [Chloroflexi bacterium]|nr:transposase [Chloroflexota bacterium]
AVARHQAGRMAALVKIALPDPPTSKKARARRADFTFALHRAALRRVCRREGRYLVRTNLTETDPAKVWEFYLILVAVEAAFRNLKGDLAVRPIYHQKESRIEAHIFVAFLAYCLHVTLQAKLRPKAPGLTPRAVLEKFAALQMVDVHFPTTDGRELVFRRYTQPEKDQKILLAQLGWELPPQSPPRISARGGLEAPAV